MNNCHGASDKKNKRYINNHLNLQSVYKVCMNKCLVKLILQSYSDVWVSLSGMGAYMSTEWAHEDCVQDVAHR